jgi:hypothetical protein
VYASGAASYGSLNIEAGDPFIRLYDNDGVADTRKWDIRAIGASGSQAIEFRTINDANTSFSTKLWIAQSGFLGIGTTSPQAKLHISGGSDYNTMFASDSNRSGWVIAVPGTTSAKASGLLLADQSFRFGTGSYYHIVMSQDGTTQIFSTGGSAATTFAPGGNLGVGTTSPAGKLTVQSAGATGLLLDQDINNSGVSSRFVARYASGTGTIRYDAGGWRFNTGATIDSTSGTERALITQDGYFRMLSGTAGIQFGGNTAAVNALNYYEIGTWTPTFYWSGGANYTVGGISGGNYTRIGSIVTLNWHLQWSAVDGGSQSGTLRIGNIPFACGSYRSAGTISAISGGIGQSSTSYSWHTLTIDPGTSFIYWIQNNAAGGYSHSPSVASGGTVYSFEITYSIH